MNHPYLRAYMAGIAVPTSLLLIALALFSVARFAYHLPVPVERVIIFPMAIIPNVFGVWNMLYLGLRSPARPSLGLFGALLPFVLAPLGYVVARCLGFLTLTEQGLVYFGVIQIEYGYVLMIFCLALIIYYLVWKHLIGFLNQVVGLGA